MVAISEFLKEHAWKDISIHIGNGDDSILFFDWKDLVAQDTAIITKGRSLSKEEQEGFFGHAKFWSTALFEHFCSEDAQEKIEHEEWLPIAVLGLYYRTDTFAEMSNNGFLALVLKDGDHKKGSVIWFNQDNDEDTQVLAGSIEDLKITFNGAPEEGDAGSAAAANSVDEQERHAEPPYKDLWDSSMSHAMKKDYDASLADLMKIYKDLAQNVAVLKALAQVSSLTKDFSNAIQYIDAALMLKPKSISLLVTKGEILMATDRFSDAVSLGETIEKLGRADDDDSDAAKGTAMKAICLVKMGKADEARPLLIEAEEKGSFLDITFEDFRWAKTQAGID